MASFLALLSQQTPNLHTRKALLLLGLQHDFLDPDGKLPISPEVDFSHRLANLVPTFRQFGHIVWVRSEFEANRAINVDGGEGDSVVIVTAASDRKLIATAGNASNDDSCPHSPARSTRPRRGDGQPDDEELFLTRTATREPCCVRGSRGADYASQFGALVDESQDMQLVKTHYSAFNSTSLLLTLRSRLITELYVAGCYTNLSVFATTVDAARHGLQITLIEDCLGYRHRSRHDLALEKLREYVGADTMSSFDVVCSLTHPHRTEEVDDNHHGDDDSGEDDSNDKEAPPAGKVQEVGDVSKAQPSSLLEADSDEDDGGLILPDVRDLKISNRRLNSRHVTPSHPHSQPFKTDARGQVSSRLTHAPKEMLVEMSGAHDSAHERTRRPGYDRREQDSPSYVKTRVLREHRPRHSGLATRPTIGGRDPKICGDHEAGLARVRTERAAQVPAQGRHTDMKPLFGEEKAEESAGSTITYNLLPDERAEIIFDTLLEEIDWQRMRHQTGEVPRLVCCQGDVAADGSTPIYRHPSDQTLPLRPWSPTVAAVREVAEQVVGHPLNHVLIQLYRSGADYISEHSDKTLDLQPGSSIANVSFGAQRTMRLRTKRPAPSAAAAAPPNPGPGPSPAPARTIHRVPLPHNSILVMSPATNAAYLHSIAADKRADGDRAPAERAHAGRRISLTFRRIGTFLSADADRIWGRGAVARTREEARRVVSGDAAASAALVRAFGAENQMATLDWDAVYGEGSDVLHLK